MTLIQHLADIIGAGLLGAFLVAAFCLSAADRRGYNRAKEEQRLVEGVELARPHLIVETESLSLAESPRTPTGAEPASGQVRVGVTGRSLTPRTSGNAAPTTGEEAPPQAGAPAGSLLQLLDDEPKPGDPGHRDYPWIVLPRGHAVIRGCRNSGRTVSWKDIAARLRAERIHTPTAEFRAIFDATWTPDEAAALGAWKCDSCATGRDGEQQHVSCSGCSCPCQLVAVES